MYAEAGLVDYERVADHEASHAVGAVLEGVEFTEIWIDRWRSSPIAGRVAVDMPVPLLESARLRVASIARVGCLMTINASWPDPANDHDREIVSRLNPGWPSWIWEELVADRAMEIANTPRFQAAHPIVARELSRAEHVSYARVCELVDQTAPAASATSLGRT